MLASTFVARRRHMQCRGDSDAAAAGREEKPLAPAPAHRTHGRRRGTQQDGLQRSGGSGRQPLRTVGAGAQLLPPGPGTAPKAGAKQGPGAAAAETEEAPPGSTEAAELEEAASVASSADLCAVCLEDLRGEAAATALPCSHAYHPGCVRAWLAVHRSCPCCRAAVPSPPES